MAGDTREASTGFETRPPLRRRLAAVAAIALSLGVATLAVIRVAREPLQLVGVVLLLLVAIEAGWYAVSRAGTPRRVATGIGIAAVAVALVVVVYASAWELIVSGAALLLAVGLARYALSADIRSLKAAATPGAPVPAARHAVLVMNLKSGGGKAERFHLVDECRARGIEPVVLHPGDDVRRLAADAIERGADVVGMAGGDGSQALLADVVSRHGAAMVVIPAGTRNHLALDLGLDRDDVVGALDAFADAVERRIDLADVNGRVFVNNVSLGLYATIVRSPDYREAKVDTTLKALPALLGPGAQPFDLRFTWPDGRPCEAVHVVQVSNGPYGETVAGFGTRPRMDTGRLGIVGLAIPDDGAQRRFVKCLATGRPQAYEGLKVWDASRFVVDSDEAVPAGLDGESVELQPPLVFRSMPGALRVRLPKHAIGYSPAARAMRWRCLIPDLWRTAMGRPPRPL